jgi:hypothetical protein
MSKDIEDVDEVGSPAIMEGVGAEKNESDFNKAQAGDYNEGNINKSRDVYSAVAGCD